MEIITQPEPIFIIGIEARMSNEVAFEEIPVIWQKFYQEALLEQIPQKVSGEVFALYTNFENEGQNNTGLYSFILGAQVKNFDNVPPQFVSAVIPPARRLVFNVETNHPEKVASKWQEIWTHNEYKKTFICEYERYKESGEIDIFVGIE